MPLKAYAVVRGGSRLTRRPWREVSSSFFASNLLCAAKASKGDIEGGISPSMWAIRGDGSALGEVGGPECVVSWLCALKSIKVGRIGIL